MVIRECHVFGLRIGMNGNHPCSFLVLLSSSREKGLKNSVLNEGSKPDQPSATKYCIDH